MRTPKQDQPSTTSNGDRGSDPTSVEPTAAAGNLLQRKIARRLAGRRNAEASGGGATPDLTPPTGGRPLPDPVRTKMERSFETSFADVRVHEGGNAAALGAEAYTQGNHVTFAAGRFDAESTAGQALIAHELTHVVQQRAGRVANVPAIDPDPALEAEADAVGARVAAGEPAAIAGGDASGNATAEPIQRKAIWSEAHATVKVLDMAEVVMQKELTGRAHVGYCEPTVNSVRPTTLHGDFARFVGGPKIRWSDEPQQPQHPTPSNDASTSGEVKTPLEPTSRPTSEQTADTSAAVTGEVVAATDNVGSYHLEIPSRPEGGSWTKVITGDQARNIKTFAEFSPTFAENVTIEVSDGGGETSAKTAMHEKVHREDHKRLFQEHVVPWNAHADAQVDKTFTGPNRESVEAQIYGGRPTAATIGETFVKATLAAGGKWHDHSDGKEARTELVAVTPDRVRIVFKDNALDLDQHVHDHYPELWGEVKGDRESIRARRKENKDGENSFRLKEAKEEAAKQALLPQTAGAIAIVKAFTQFATGAKSGAIYLFKSTCGIGAIAAIVAESAKDDDHPIFPGHAARFALMNLTALKELLIGLMQAEGASDALEGVKPKVALQLHKLPLTTASTSDSAVAINSVLAELARLMPR